MTPELGALIGAGLALGGMTWVAWRLPRQLAPLDDDEPPGVFGQARPATLAEALRAGMTTDSARGLWVGMWAEPMTIKRRWRAPRIVWRDHWLTYDGPAPSGLLVAPTRSGKFANGIAYTLLLNRASSFVVYDPAGQAAAVTKAERKRMGQRVVVVNPFGLLPDNLGDEPQACINPLGEAADNPMRETIVGNQAALLVRHDPASDNSYFTGGGRALTRDAGLYLLETEGARASWPAVNALLNLPARRRNEAFGRMRDSRHESVRHCGERFYIPPKIDPETGEELPGGALGKSDQEVIRTAQTELEFFAVEAMARLFGSSGFSFRELKRAPATVYLVLPDTEAKTYAKAVELLFGAAKDALLTWPPAPVALIMDELCTAMHASAADMVATLLNAGAKYGVRVQAIAQNWEQFRKWAERGGHSADALRSACGLVQFFGSNDPVTSEYIRKEAGDRTIWAPNSDLLAGMVPGQGGLSATGVPLLRDPDLRDMHQRGEQIAFVLGSGVPIVMARRPHYFDVPELRAKASHDPYH